MSLVSFPSSSVFAKEYVMSCDFLTFKLTDKPFDKGLYLRRDGEWKNHCDGANYTFTHNGDGARCEHQIFCKSERCGQFFCPIDQILIYDFFLGTKTQKFPNPKQCDKCADTTGSCHKPRVTSCKKLE